MSPFLVNCPSPGQFAYCEDTGASFSILPIAISTTTTATSATSIKKAPIIIDPPNKVAPAETFLIPESLAKFQISPAEYIQQRIPEKIDRLVAGAIVAHGDRILLVQRSEHDFGGLCWEVPGGSCDEDDLTILGSASRELWEEAGLKTTAVVDLVDDSHQWHDSGLVWKKLTFLVDVERTSTGRPFVRLDPNEHQDFVWATEDHVLANRYGDKRLTWIGEDQRQTILKAFRLLQSLTARPLALKASAEV